MDSDKSNPPPSSSSSPPSPADKEKEDKAHTATDNNKSTNKEKKSTNGAGENVNESNENVKEGKAEDDDDNDDDEETSTPKKMSKNQMKRLRKIEQAREVKRRRREQERQVKIAKAKAAGRDIEAEKKDMEQRRLDGAGWTKRNDRWQERFDKDGCKYQICLDCSFESDMTEKEINSLACQIRYCYSANKRAKHPLKVTVTSLNGITLGHLEKVSGFEQWMHRAFHHTKDDLVHVYKRNNGSSNVDSTAEKDDHDDSDEKKSNEKQQQQEETQTQEQHEQLVYLTSDSTNVLTTLEDDKIYIIGGIVDRNRLKRAAIDRAEANNITTAKLPIDEYLSMVATKVLTCNHVFEILLKYKEHGNDWKKAFLDVLPIRKDAKDKG